MGTATSRALALGLAALALGGCGASATPSSPASSRAAGALALMGPASAPAGWQAARIPTGATLHYPPDWQSSGGDAGTATAVLRDRHRSIVGYLNITPRQGAETLTDWPSFRVGHNRHEGDRDVRSEALARHVRFTNASGTCVRDRYTVSDASYIEIACLAQGAHASTVIVAAASRASWAALSPLLYRAIAAFTT
ncbi:MAG TPA: hypothetical protein VIC05_06080 [Solirubrobacteraceae bacterium]